MATKSRNTIITLATICAALFCTPHQVVAQDSQHEEQSPPERQRAPVTQTLETQFSAMTSEYADQIFARLTVQEKREVGDWHVRGSYSRTATRSGTSRSEVSSARLDSRLEHVTGENRFDVWTGIVNWRDRTLSSGRKETSGYHYASYGVGKQLDPRTKGDLGIGLLGIRDEYEGVKPVIGCSVTGRQNLNSKLVLDTRLLAIQRVDKLGSVKVDSELGLSYALSKDLSLRLGWTANSLVRHTQVTGEWDSVVRLTISFRQTTRR